MNQSVDGKAVGRFQAILSTIHAGMCISGTGVWMAISWCGGVTGLTSQGPGGKGKGKGKGFGKGKGEEEGRAEGKGKGKGKGPPARHWGQSLPDAESPSSGAMGTQGVGWVGNAWELVDSRLAASPPSSFALACMILRTAQVIRLANVLCPASIFRVRRRLDPSVGLFACMCPSLTCLLRCV